MTITSKELYYRDIKNQSVITTKVNRMLNAKKIKGNVRVRDDNIVECTIKRRSFTVKTVNGFIYIDEYKYTDAEDACEYIVNFFQEN